MDEHRERGPELTREGMAPKYLALSDFQLIDLYIQWGLSWNGMEKASIPAKIRVWWLKHNPFPAGQRARAFTLGWIYRALKDEE